MNIFFFLFFFEELNLFEVKKKLFNLFSKTHKTISNPKANTTIDIIRKNILSENFEYNIYDTPGFYKFSDFTDLLNKILTLKLENIKFIYLISSFTYEDLKICKQLHSKNYNILLFSFKMIDEKEEIVEEEDVNKISATETTGVEIVKPPKGLMSRRVE